MFAPKALIPTIKWSQNNEYIIVNLEINQVKKDVYELNSNNIIFSGLCNTGLTYSINLELLNEINKDESKYIVQERVVRFILKKTSDEKWIRLTKDKNQYKSNIKVNWDNFEDSDEENDIEPQNIQQNQQFDLSSMMGNNGFNMEEMMKNMDPSQMEQLMKSMNMGEDDNDNDSEDENEDDNEYQDQELENEINNIINDDEDDSIDSNDLCKECA